MTPKLYTGLRKANDKEKNQAAATKLKSWPLTENFMAICDKICCTLAALGGCTLKRGSFACTIVRGDMQLAT